MIEKRTNYLAFNIPFESKDEVVSALGKLDDFNLTLASVDFLKEDQKKIAKLCKEVANEKVEGKIISAFVSTKIANAMVESGEVSPSDLGTTEEDLENCMNACNNCDLEFFKKNLRKFVKRESIEDLISVGLELVIFIEKSTKPVQRELNGYVTGEMATPITMIFAESKPATTVDNSGNFLRNKQDYFDVNILDIAKE